MAGPATAVGVPGVARAAPGLKVTVVVAYGTLTNDVPTLLWLIKVRVSVTGDKSILTDVEDGRMAPLGSETVGKGVSVGIGVSICSSQYLDIPGQVSLI